jgi:voltage-gated potassium channel
MSPIHRPILKRLVRLFGQPEVRYPVTLVIILLATIIGFAFVFAIFEEGATFGDGLWTAYITLTTIGYGDFSAQTTPGRLVTVISSMFGIGCFGVFTGIIVEKAMQRRVRKLKGEGSYQGENHVVIFNIPAYEEIKELLKELDLSPDFREVPRVIVTPKLPNNDAELPSFISNKIDGFIMGVPSDMDTLQRANIAKSRACLFLGSTSEPAMDDTNTLTAGLVEKNWPQIITILACSRAETVKNLSMFNIDSGLSATDLKMGLLVQELEDPGLFEVYSQLSSNAGGSQIYISRTPVGDWLACDKGITFGKLQKALLELDLPPELIGIKQKTEDKVTLNPERHLPLQNGDRLIYMARERFNWLGEKSEINKKAI